MKLLCLLFARLWFRFRAFNTEVLKTPGPVLLIPNHVSWLDWLFLYAVLDDDWKFVTSATTAETTWVHKKMMVNRRTFPVDTTSPYAAKRMAEFLATGGRLVLFAEGRITLTGSLMKLFDGTGFLIHKTGAKVITCYLRNARRVPFVRHTGWTHWRPRVTAHFSGALTAPALPDGTSNSVARQRRTTWLRDMMVRQQFEAETELGAQNVLNAVVETAALLPRKIIFEDVSFTELTYRRLMVGVDVLAGEWRKRLGPAPHIGVLLPNVPLIARKPRFRPYHGSVNASLEERLDYLKGLSGKRRVINSQAHADEEAPFDIAKATKDELIATLIGAVEAREPLQCSGQCSQYPGTTAVAGSPDMCSRPCGTGLLNLANIPAAPSGGGGR
jgi:1-acyl-sn-glycerol-3-phosphate acyltransferase